MKKTRKGVFETNSSSTHSICIAKDAELTIPKSIHFKFGDFGWESDTLYSMEEKASYLYTALMNNRREDDMHSIEVFLKQQGIKVTGEQPVYKPYTYEGNTGGEYISNGGHVDHSDALNPFLDELCKDNNKLMRFLFSDLSFIRTGNDNDESDISIRVDYEHDKYYKGN